MLNTEQKIAKSKELVEKGEVVEAIRTIKALSHLPAETKKTLEIAYEMHTLESRLYLQMGYNKTRVTQEAVFLIKNMSKNGK